MMCRSKLQWIILLLLGWNLSVKITIVSSNLNNPSTKLPNGQADPVAELNKLKLHLKESKQAMCSFLLTQTSTNRNGEISNGKDVKLTLENVEELFKQALDHIGKSANYAALIRPHVNPKVIEDFDNNGRNFVLEVSQNIRSLSIEYELANSVEEKYSILEKYFYNACANKLGTIIAEKSMFDSFKNMEAKLSLKAQGVKG